MLIGLALICISLRLIKRSHDLLVGVWVLIRAPQDGDAQHPRLHAAGCGAEPVGALVGLGAGSFVPKGWFVLADRRVPARRESPARAEGEDPSGLEPLYRGQTSGATPTTRSSSDRCSRVRASRTLPSRDERCRRDGPCRRCNDATRTARGLATRGDCRRAPIALIKHRRSVSSKPDGGCITSDRFAVGSSKV